MSRKVLSRDGFVRCCGVVNEYTCERVRNRTIAQLRRLKLNPMYHLHRFGLYERREWGGIVKAPLRRHAFPILHRNGDSDKELMNAIRQVARTYVDTVGNRNAALVELSAMIAYPGTKSQRRHMDIAADVEDVSGYPPLVTCWLALQDVKCLGDGPTICVPESHIRFRDRAKRIRSQQAEISTAHRETGDMIKRTYDMEGNLVLEEDPFLLRTETKMRSRDETDTSREMRDFGEEKNGVPILMNVGDVTMMDCRVSHYGSEMDSSKSEPRVLLNLSFASMRQNETYETCLNRMLELGFTAHIHPDVCSEQITARDLLVSE